MMWGSVHLPLRRTLNQICWQGLTNFNPAALELSHLCSLPRCVLCSVPRVHILFGVDALLWCACVPSGRVLMGEQRCRHGAGNQRNRFEKGAARVNLCSACVSCAVSAATPATHVCVCVKGHDICTRRHADTWLCWHTGSGSLAGPLAASKWYLLVCQAGDGCRWCIGASWQGLNYAMATHL